MVKRDFLIPLRRFWKAGRLFVTYALDWIYLAIAIGLCQRGKNKGPVILCMANPGSLGGTELQVELIAAALTGRFGSSLVLLSGTCESGKKNLFLKRLDSLKIPVLRLRSLGIISYESRPFLAKKTAYLLAKRVKRGKICHFFNPASTHLAPVIKSLGLRVYYMETGMPVLEGSWWKPLKTTLPHFEFVSSVSFAGLQRLTNFYGYKGPSCITPSLFHPAPPNFFCRKPIEKVFNIVYFGRMTRNKGVDLLIEAFHRLLQEFPYARLFLIGSGERLSLLQTQAKTLFLANQIHFFGWLQNEALFSQLINMDLFCLPSFTEGLPCSILEAMSIGLPIIATNVGGIGEILEHNLSGLLIPPRDEEALTNALLELARSPLRRMELRDEAFFRWKNAGSKEVVLERLFAAYRRV